MHRRSRRRYALLLSLRRCSLGESESDAPPLDSRCDGASNAPHGGTEILLEEKGRIGQTHEKETERRERERGEHRKSIRRTRREH